MDNSDTRILENKTGRLVEVPADKAEWYIRALGFRLPTKEQEKSFLLQREATVSDTGFFDVQYAAPAPHSDGYGQSHKHLQDALLEEGVRLSRKYEGQKVGLAFGYPHNLNALKTEVKILFTMFESTKIPQEWHEDLVKADLIITPGRWVQKVFKDEGYDSVIVPLGYDSKTFDYRPKDTAKEPFTFLHYDAFKMRKGWDLVFKAFNEEFKNEAVKLILKTTHTVIPVPIPRSQYPNIEVIKDEMRHEELAELLHSSDCFVLPSRGEGFGHPPLEALATGTPVITSNSSGISEYFNPQYFIEVAIKEMVPAMYDRFMGQDVGKMYEADVDDLKVKMRFAYENRSYITEQAARGAEWAKNNWTYQKTALKLAPILKGATRRSVSDVESHYKPSVKHSIIMLTYNALKYTKKAIEAVNQHSKDYELIVIDNASTDGTQEYLESMRDRGSIHTLVLNKENAGVAGGRNQGIALSSGDIITFLDNDTEVGPGWQDTVLNEFDVEDVGIVGLKGQLVPFMRPIRFMSPTKDDNARAIVDVVPGFCFTFRRSLLGIIGKQWADFPNGKFWHEDLEFCIRAKMAGYKIITNENISIKHYEHKSVGENISNEVMVDKVEGFFENAAYILSRMVSSNIAYFYREWAGFDNHASYDRVAYDLSEKLRDLGMVVIRRDTIHTNPPSFDLCKGFDIIFNGKRYIWLHQENDRPPENWRVAMSYVDYAFAASPHVLEVCKNEPYFDKLIDVSPDGVNGDIFNTRVKPLTDLHPDKFKFLMVGASQPRKNTQNLIKWYSETFTIKDPVVLIIKDVGYGHRKETEAFIEKIKRSNKNAPEIDYIYAEWSSEYLAKAYRAVALNGAYIHPHKAECFGLPHIEAAATGCRIGTTKWGGPKYTLKDLPTVTYFPYEMAPSTFHNHAGEPYYKSGEDPQWAEPDESYVKKFMLDMVKEKYNVREANLASKEILKRYHYADVSKRIFNVFMSHAKSSIKEVRV